VPRGGACCGRGAGRGLHRFMEPCLLLLLRRGPSHGYDLAQGLAELGLPGVDPSLAYRLLRQMEEAGLVHSEWDTRVSSGPARRVYRLTPDGDALLADWVAELEGTDRVLHGFLAAYREQQAKTDESCAGAEPEGQP